MESEYQASLGDAFMAQPRVGERLREARLHKGLEIVDIARETRVPQRHLNAIEEDAHDSLPALPYTIGFVKSFARAVGLAPDEVSAQFRAETTKTTHVPQMVPLEPLDEARVPSKKAVLLSLIALAALIALVLAWGSGAFERDAAPVAASVPPAVMTDDGQVVVQDTAFPSAAPAAPVAGPAPGGPVVMTATEDAWIKVYDRTGATIRMGILKDGESYEVPQGDLLLWTGKAGALRLTAGGQALPALGGMIETVKDVSLMPAALASRQAAPPAPSTGTPG